MGTDFYYILAQTDGLFNNFSKRRCVERFLVSDLQSCIGSTLITVKVPLLFSMFSLRYLAVFLVTESRLLYIFIDTSAFLVPLDI